MVDENVRELLAMHLANLEEESTLALVRDLLAAGHTPLEIIQVCEQGTRAVGERYEQGEYYLSALIMAGEIFHQVVELIQPHLNDAHVADASGKILLGTVQGDIHDIGKNMFGMFVRSTGFAVEDLGVDVAPSRFVERARASQPDVIGLSGLLTTSFDSMRETVRLLRAELASSVRPIQIVVGGGMMNAQVCRYVGADYWSSDAMEGIRICQRIVRQA